MTNRNVKGITISIDGKVIGKVKSWEPSNKNEDMTGKIDLNLFTFPGIQTGRIKCDVSNTLPKAKTEHIKTIIPNPNGTFNVKTIEGSLYTNCFLSEIDNVQDIADKISVPVTMSYKS
jgi:hypothetical protein